MLGLAAALLVVTAVCLTVSAKDSDGDIVIVIDAGHGGHDPGMTAVTGTYEKDCNLDIAIAMKEELCKYKGVKVYLTRSDDVWMTNTGRAMVAADLHADFLISVHNNSGAESNSGCIAYRSLNEHYSEATNEMCSLITDNLAKLGLANGGVQTRESTQYAGEDFYTLIAEGVRAGVPSIIVEHCFLSNPGDAAFLTNADGTVNKETARLMGIADANAVATYFDLTKRTAIADSQTTVTLLRGSSVVLSMPDYTGSDVTWYSIEPGVAIVDESGVATAVGTGTTNIVYKQPGGTTGYCTVTVSAPEPVALIGGIDPTFYKTFEELSAINLKDVFAFVIYSDGSAARVVPEVTGKVDFTKVGIQDIEIKYGELTGYVRIFNTSQPYVPEVTLPAETQAPAETEAVTDSESGGSQTDENITTAAGTKEEDGSFNTTLIKYILVLLIVIVIGIILFILENNRRKKRSTHRRRRY